MKKKKDDRTLSLFGRQPAPPKRTPRAPRARRTDPEPSHVAAAIVGKKIIEAFRARGRLGGTSEEITNDLRRMYPGDDIQRVSVSPRPCVLEESGHLRRWPKERWRKGSKGITVTVWEIAE